MLGLTFYIRLVLLTLTLELGAGLHADVATTPTPCISQNDSDIVQWEYRNTDSVKDYFQPFEIIEKEEQNNRSDDNDNIKYNSGPALHLLHQLYAGRGDEYSLLNAVYSAFPIWSNRFLFILFHCWKFHL